jgi:plasmid stabilization system protein ParE
MLRIEKRAQFRGDFINQFSWYVDEGGEDAAQRFQIALDQTILRIARNPTLGRPRRFKHIRLEGLRSIQVQPPFERFLLFFRFDSNLIEITRLIEGSRKLARRLSEFD